MVVVDFMLCLGKNFISKFLGEVILFSQSISPLVLWVLKSGLFKIYAIGFMVILIAQ